MTQEKMTELREKGLQLIDNDAYDEGLQMLREAAEAGDIPSVVFIGCHYYETEDDEKEASKWFMKADELFDEAGEPTDNEYIVNLMIYSHRSMGDIYEGRGDHFMAYIEYCGAFNLGCHEVLYMMGKLAYDGYTTPDGSSDVNEALGYWKTGMESGDTACEQAYNEHLIEQVPEIEDPETIDFENGDCYEGTVNAQGQPDGYGVMTYKKQPYHEWMKTSVSFDTYRGHWKDGKREGFGRMTYYMNGSGSVEYNGEWHDDQPHGKGSFKKYSSVTDETYTGEWQNGKRHGHGHYYEHWDKGTFPTFEYDGDWENDLQHGYGTSSSASPYPYSPKDVYEGEWYEGCKQGQGTMRFKNGDVYEGRWCNNFREGHGKLTRADGTWMEGEWKDNQPQMETIVNSEGSDKPMLKLKVHCHGFDYSETMACMLKVEEGPKSFSDVTYLSGDRFSESENTIITILSFDHDSVTYEVAGRYFKDFQPRQDTICRGETKDYHHETKKTATIYDDDYDYTVCDQLTMTCY